MKGGNWGDLGTVQDYQSVKKGPAHVMGLFWAKSGRTFPLDQYHNPKRDCCV